MMKTFAKRSGFSLAHLQSRAPTELARLAERVARLSEAVPAAGAEALRAHAVIGCILSEGRRWHLSRAEFIAWACAQTGLHRKDVALLVALGRKVETVDKALSWAMAGQENPPAEWFTLDGASDLLAAHAAATSKRSAP